MIKYKPWEVVPHKVWYSTEEERLYTSYELWVMFKESDNAEEYKDDFYYWFSDCIRYDLLRPIVAATVIWVLPEDGGQVPLFVDGYVAEADAEKECEAWGWFYDDGFTGGSRPMSVVNFDECTEEARDWLTDPANNYGGPSWDSVLYGGVPEDVLTIK